MTVKFTREQEDHICYQIGKWYVHWKDRLIQWEDRTHKLGFAKEQLKEMLCPLYCKCGEPIKSTFMAVMEGERVCHQCVKKYCAEHGMDASWIKE